MLSKYSTTDLINELEKRNGGMMNDFEKQKRTLDLMQIKYKVEQWLYHTVITTEKNNRYYYNKQDNLISVEWGETNDKLLFFDESFGRNKQQI